MSAQAQREQRRHEGEIPSDSRTSGQRDRDRILYTSALRRLGGITQVVAPVERQVTHNRLTHTLEVAQIARRLAEYLTATEGDRTRAVSAGGIDPDVVEAAALAHDLGHPPFGHVAEDVLDRCCRKILPEGFNGNAQSFRILTKLSIRKPDFPGLNLTRATLNAVMKYPCLRHGKFGEKRCENRWGAYRSESVDFDWARSSVDANGPRTVEAEIVDWADDVAYAVHDLEDFYRAGLIPLDRLTRNDGKNEDAEFFISKKVCEKGVGYAEACLAKPIPRI